MMFKSKLDDKLIEYAKNYLETAGDKYEKFVKSDGEKNTTYDYRLKVTLPTYVGLSVYIRKQDDSYDIREQDIKNWSFSGTGLKQQILGDIKKIEDLTEHQANVLKICVHLSNIVELQKTMLLNGAISSRYSPAIAKMILSVNHGMREVEEVKHTGIIGLTPMSELTTEQLIKLKESQKMIGQGEESE